VAKRAAKNLLLSGQEQPKRIRLLDPSPYRPGISSNNQNLEGLKKKKKKKKQQKKKTIVNKNYHCQNNL
jgi:hypothetical protein